MAKTPTVSIIGGTVWGNRGAESMLTTTIGMIRKDFPQAKFNVFSYYPKKDRELIGDENITVLSNKPLALVTRHYLAAVMGKYMRKMHMKIPGSNFFKIARAFSESDMLIDVGGITFSDGREKFLPFNVLTIWPAMIMGVPVIKLAQAVGPFKNPFNRFFANWFLKPCRYIFARGEKTAEFLADLGYPADKTQTVADVAFLYQPEFSLSKENENKVDDLLKKVKSLKKELIVFSPSILVAEQSAKKNLDYSAKFFSVILSLGTRNYHFVFIPNATREGSEGSHNNDLLTLQQMRALAENGALPKEYLDGIDWVIYDINTASIRRIISAADVLVTSRYHAMISGLSLAVPTVVIGWGHKYKETMDYFDLGEFSLDFGAANLNIPAMVSRALKENADIRKKIKQNLDSVKKKSVIQFTFIKQVLS